MAVRPVADSSYARTALINDGQLQLRIFTGDGLLPALLYHPDPVQKTARILLPVNPRGLIVNAPHGMTFNLDGEPLSGKQFRIEVLPGALQLPAATGLPASALTVWPGGGNA